MKRQRQSRTEQNRETHPGAGPPALDLLEESYQLVRQAPLSAWAIYLAGCAPFLLAFLTFWAALSRSASAGNWLSAGALLLALLYLWMKWTQTHFVGHLWKILTRTSGEPPPTPARGASLFLFHARWQSTAWVVLPLAALLTIPFPAAFAFYQNLVILPQPGSSLDPEAIRKRAWTEARRWPMTTIRASFFFSLLGLLLFLNLLGLFALVPQLLKAVFGIETAFSRDPFILANTTVLALAAALALLALDPLIKGFFLLKAHYGESRLSGLDLRIRLNIRRTLPKLAALSLFLVLLAPGYDLQAQSTAAPAEPDPAAMTEAPSGVENAIDNAIDRTLQDPRFAWKLPRERTPDDASPSFLRGLIEWFRNLIERWQESNPEEPERRDPRQQGWGLSLDWLFYLLIAAAAFVLIIAIVRIIRRRQRPTPAAPDTAAIGDTFDLEDENVTADLLSRNEWIRLGQELRERGEFRQALRACFLGQLALLQDRGQLRLSRHKSNREYLAELRRRDQHHPGLVESYVANMTDFEAGWYGDHPVDDAALERFLERLDNLERIAG